MKIARFHSRSYILIEARPGLLRTATVKYSSGKASVLASASCSHPQTMEALNQCLQQLLLAGPLPAEAIILSSEAANRLIHNAIAPRQESLRLSAELEISRLCEAPSLARLQHSLGHEFTLKNIDSDSLQDDWPIPEEHWQGASFALAKDSYLAMLYPQPRLEFWADILGAHKIKLLGLVPWPLVCAPPPAQGKALIVAELPSGCQFTLWQDACPIFTQLLAADASSAELLDALRQGSAQEIVICCPAAAWPPWQELAASLPQARISHADTGPGPAALARSAAALHAAKTPSLLCLPTPPVPLWRKLPILWPLCLAAAAALVYIPSAKARSLANEQAAQILLLKQSLQELGLDHAEILQKAKDAALLQSQQEDLNRQLEQLQRSSQASGNSIADLPALASALLRPDGLKVQLHSLQWEGSTCTVTGLAADLPALTTYAQQLRAILGSIQIKIEEQPPLLYFTLSKGPEAQP